MTLLPIVIAPDQLLKTRAEPVTVFDDRLYRLTEDMLETMYAAPGIGLAAPQVGVLQRVTVIDLAEKGEAAAPMKLVNPEIVWKSDELGIYNEGCLSLPDTYADVTRPDRVKVKYQDVTGTAHAIDADDLLATCLQHEIDHLNGVLFTDHLSAVRRSMIMRRMQKLKKQKGL